MLNSSANRRRRPKKKKVFEWFRCFMHQWETTVNFHIRSMIFPVPQVATNGRHSLHLFTSTFGWFEWRGTDFWRRNSCISSLGSEESTIRSSVKIIASVFVIRRWFITNKMHLFDIIIMCEWVCTSAMRWVDVIGHNFTIQCAVQFYSVVSVCTHCRIRCNWGRGKI